MGARSLLATRDYQRILDLIAEIVAGACAQSPWARVAAELNDCLRGTTTVYHAGFDVRRRTTKGLEWAPASASWIAWEAHARECGEDYPLTSVCAEATLLEPVTISDLMGDLRWFDTACYSAIRHNTDGSTRHLALTLPAPRGIARAFLVRRSGTDYRPREREFARVLQPLLIGLDRHLRELDRLRARVAATPAADATRPPAADPGLTPRELTVLGLAAEGLTAAAAARRLGISPHTVNKHLENSYRKLDARERTTAVLRARDLRLLPVSANVWR
jgi:DNA-binding CsgD family transcriptional regulator